MNNVTNQSKRPNLTTVLLAVSLAINIALVGFVLGRWYGAPPPHSAATMLGPVAPPNVGLGRFILQLEPDRREALRHYLRAHFKSLRPSLRASGSAYRQVQKSLVQQPFVAADLQQALQQLASSHQQAQQMPAATFTELVTQLSLAERQQLAKFMRKPRRHDKHHQRGVRLERPAPSPAVTPGATPTITQQ